MVSKAVTLVGKVARSYLEIWNFTQFRTLNPNNPQHPKFLFFSKRRLQQKPSPAPPLTMAVDEDTPATHVLFESASGYALFKAKQVEEIGAKVTSLQSSYLQ